ncbi:MAG: diguanylate cyclase [Desulfobacterales bacterium]|nr:diguanylate cyclase [Desulfobacterales bacterium]
MDTKILIVDDDEAVRDTMNEIIMLAGYKSYTAASAEEALEFLKKKSVQVVIADIMLPGLDGLELTDRIKAKYDTDIIVMTGYSGDYSYEEAISKGASDFVFKPVRFEELLLRLKRVLKERQLAKERAQMLETLQKLAITDGLTKLYNSRHFYSQLEMEVDRSSRYHHPLALLLLDIDHFKIYNDTYGHIEGDKVLVRLGEIIKSCLRTMDSAYRYGGEEFTIILPETSGNEALAVAQRIRVAVESEKFIAESDKRKATRITISVGVTEYCSKEDLSTFVKRADKAMYTSKQKGRNTVSGIFVEKPASAQS